VVINRGGLRASTTSRKVLIMKKIFSLLFLSAIASIVYAAHPAASDNSVYDAKFDTVVTTIDSVGTTTTQNIVVKRRLPKERGWNYYLINKTITGANASNTELIVSVLCYNAAGTLLSTVVIDTIVGAASQSIILPINVGLVGDRFTVMLTGGGANGAAIYTQGFQLVMYRPIESWNK
jgi:hypothetical protein